MTTIKQRTFSLDDCHFQTPLSPLVQRVLAARGVTSDTDIDYRLQKLTNPNQLKGIASAVVLLSVALQQQQRVLIVGDFDADGATSSALAVLVLRAFGLQYVDFLVPNRFEYGYGLTPEIVEVAAASNPDLIITVDNGIASIEGVAAAKALGIQVIVTDHHLPGRTLPAADAIVNPNQPGCDFPSKQLAGVGVIFYLLSALRGHLRTEHWFEQQKLDEPKMADFLDLVALGTVADVVPLDHHNRILVQQGLQRIRAGHARPGIMALLEVAGKNYQRLVSSDLGFIVGPRLNAAGRLDDISIGIQCLLTDAPDQARALAIELDQLNRERRAIEASMQQEALASLAKLQLDDQQLPWGVCLYDDTWHQGVVGILASRIKEKYHRPVIAFAEVDEHTIKGSARSIAGLHIRDTLDRIATEHPAILSKFGGHAMAAGLSLAKCDYPAFCTAFDLAVKQQLTQDDLAEVRLTDGALAPSELTLAQAHQLRQLGPWGQAFPEPVFDGEFYVVSQRIVGSNHLKMVLSTTPQQQQLIDAIAFNIDAECWPDESVNNVRIVYTLDVNEFRGRESVQLIVNYIEAIKVDTAITL